MKFFCKRSSPLFLRTFVAASLCSPGIFAMPTASGDLNKPGQYVIKADQVDGDRVNNLLTAVGDVEISKGSTVVHSDKIIYDRDNGNIRAVGHVTIKNLEVGNLFAESAQIDDDFGRGKFTNSKMIFSDGSYMDSPEIKRQSQSVTVLKSPIYSLCPDPEIEADNNLAGKKRNFASMKSAQTVIDREEGVTRSKHVVMRFYDVPVLYIPYIKTTLASKKRESGFLTPFYAKSTNLGLGIRTPYYFNIAPNLDWTLTPFFGISSGQIILTNEVRHRTTYGKYNMNVELANNKLVRNTTISASNQSSLQYRWNIAGTGKFDFTKNTGFDFQSNMVSDRNYFKDYRFNYNAFTLSRGTLDYVKGRDYHAFNLINIQELENKLTQKQAPIVPEFESYIESQPQGDWGKKLALSSNFTTIYRTDGLQYRRLSLTPEVSLPMNFHGNLVTLDAKVQGDVYSLDSNYSGSAPKQYSDVIVSNKPEASIKWSLPLLKKAKDSTIMIEPMANLVISSFNGNLTKLPNEDANNSELSISNMFVTDRISGFDRNEAGKRVSYGLKTSYFNRFGEFGLIAGQSFRERDKSQDVRIKGFAANNKSNIVGQALYKAQKYFQLIYSFQINQSNYRNDVNQLTTILTLDRFKFTSDFLLMRRSDQNASKREQVNFSLQAKLNKEWSTTASMTKDVVLNREIFRSIAFQREGCCMVVGFSLISTNPSDLVKAQQSYNFFLSFKNL